MLIEKTMFREYDIRGRVNERELNEISIELIGKAFGLMLKNKKIKDCVLGFDAKSYSENFANIFEKSLNSLGINTINIRMATTPMAYFAQYLFKVKGVAVITASHNPNGWSGLKLGYDFSFTLLSNDVQELYQIIEKLINGKENLTEKEKGLSIKQNIEQAYYKELIKRVPLKNKLRIVVNGRNGIGGKILSSVLKKANQEVIEQFCNIDFSYPNGDANPSLDDMMLETGKLVIKEKADLGFAIDADGDRLGLVDELGNNIYPDKFLVLLARDSLKKFPRSSIVFDVKCTKALVDDIIINNGNPVMWKTGHSYIKQKAQEINAVLAGERSGHIFFFKDYYGFDDACFAALKLLNYIQSENQFQNQKLSEIIKTIPKYYTSQVFQAECSDTEKYLVMEKITQKFKKKYNVIDINGARVEFEDSWGLIRPSSNLPVMVMVFEAKTIEKLQEIQELFKKELANFPEISQKWVNG